MIFLPSLDLYFLKIFGGSANRVFESRQQYKGLAQNTSAKLVTVSNQIRTGESSAIIRANRLN
jgi:hypothetical protein